MHREFGIYIDFGKKKIFRWGGGEYPSSWTYKADQFLRIFMETLNLQEITFAELKEKYSIKFDSRSTNLSRITFSIRERPKLCYQIMPGFREIEVIDQLIAYYDREIMELHYKIRHPEKQKNVETPAELVARAIKTIIDNISKIN